MNERSELGSCSDGAIVCDWVELVSETRASDAAGVIEALGDGVDGFVVHAATPALRGNAVRFVDADEEASLPVLRGRAASYELRSLTTMRGYMAITATKYRA